MSHTTHSPNQDELLVHEAACPPRQRPRPASAPRVGIALALLLAAVFVVAGSQRAESQTAPQPIVGLYTITRVSVNDSSPLRTVSTHCEPGDYVVGGGAHARGETLAVNQLLSLGEMRPVGAPNPWDGRHGFSAYAQEITPGTTSSWVLSVYAQCATEVVPGYRVVTSSQPWAYSEDFGGFKLVSPSCGTGRVALGAGARIEHGTDQPDPLAVGLDEVRPLADGTGTQVGATEWPSGYSGTWRLKGYAICAYRPLGYQVRHTSSTGRAATVTCTEDGQVLGAGAASFAPLIKAVPRRGPEGVMAEAPRTGATSGRIEAWAACADTVPVPSDLPPPTTPCPPDLPRCEQQ